MAERVDKEGNGRAMKPNLLTIKCSLIQVPHVRARSLVTPHFLAALRESIQSIGQVEPVIVADAGDRYILIDGEHRYREICARQEYITAVILYDIDETTIDLLNLATAVLKAPPDPISVIQLISRLRARGVSCKQIARAVGKSERWCYMLSQISQAPSWFLEMASKHKASLRKIMLLWKLYTLDPIAFEADVRSDTVWSMSLRGLRDYVASRIEAQLARERAAVLEAAEEMAWKAVEEAEKRLQQQPAETVSAEQQQLSPGIQQVLEELEEEARIYEIPLVASQGKPGPTASIETTEQRPVETQQPAPRPQPSHQPQPSQEQPQPALVETAAAEQLVESALHTQQGREEEQPRLEAPEDPHTLLDTLQAILIKIIEESPQAATTALKALLTYLTTGECPESKQ